MLQDLDHRDTIPDGPARVSCTCRNRAAMLTPAPASYFAANTAVGTWSQSVPTVAGVHYTLTSGPAAALELDNSIAVNWNGQTVIARRAP